MKENYLEHISAKLSLIFTKKGDLTLDEFIFLTRCKLSFTKATTFGFNLADPKLCEIYDELSFNPYKIKYDSTIGSLRKMCFGGSLAKIKEQCKKVKPDVICLRNACTSRYNSRLIEYLVNEHKLDFDEICLYNTIKELRGSIGSTVYSLYEKQIERKGIDIHSLPQLVKELPKELPRETPNESECVSSEDSENSEDSEDSEEPKATKHKPEVKRKAIIKKGAIKHLVTITYN